MNNDLVEGIASQRTILFVGAGVSASLGAPTWRGLVERMAEELGFDPRILAPAGVSFLTLAEYYRIKTGVSGIERLCEEINSKWDVKVADLTASPVLKRIHELDFPSIYTTNYDHNLENALGGFGRAVHVVREVHDIASTPKDCTQVVKFHGDANVPESLVMTESNYFERLGFETPLDIKLRADALGKNILFLGYSLSDINMRLLLYKLSRMWERAPSSSARPRSFLLLQRPNDMEQTVLDEWGIDVLTHDVDDPKKMLDEFLAELARAVARRRTQG